MRKPMYLTSLLLLAACGGSGTPPGTTPVAMREGSTAVTKVTNDSFADFNIYVSWNQTRTRLGRSRANSQDHFPIPESVVGEGGRRLRILAEPIGARATGITREYTVQQGDTVFVHIPPT